MTQTLKYEPSRSRFELLNDPLSNISPHEDFQAELEHFFLLCIVNGNNWDVVVADVDKIPVKAFGILRAGMLAKGINLQCTYAEHAQYDLMKRRLCISQFTYSGGPFDGEPIDKYSWFDEREFVWLEEGDRKGLYTKTSEYNQSMFDDGRMNAGRSVIQYVPGVISAPPAIVRAGVKLDLEQIRQYANEDLALRSYPETVAKSAQLHRIEVTQAGRTWSRTFHPSEAEQIKEFVQSARDNTVMANAHERDYVKIGSRFTEIIRKTSS